MHFVPLLAALAVIYQVFGYYVERTAEGETILTIPLEKRQIGARRMQDGYRTVEFTKRESDGVYWATIRIGTPPQTFSVIVDTGSSTIAVPCKNCDCGKHNKFNPDLSSSVQHTGVTYNQCYSEGSCNTGEMLSDLACFGDECTANETVRHNFGCAISYAKAFKLQDADGIIGLSGSPDTLIADLRAHHSLQKDMFALCFGRNGGSLTVGGVYRVPWLEDPTWIPLASSGMFYAVEISSVSLDGVVIPNTATYPQPIIDSGSTFTYFPAAVHQATINAFNAFCNKGGNRCRGVRSPSGTTAEDLKDSIACFAPPSDVTDIDKWMLDSFPPIQIQFKDKTVCIPPPTYFFLSNLAAKSFCVGILRDQKFVLGAITMADFSVIFDHENNRVGFARSNCDGNRNVTCCSKQCPGSSVKPPTVETLAPTPTTLVDPDDIGPDITVSPTVDYIPTFWQTNVQVVSALFFMLGIFFALFCACTVWLCCPSVGASAARGSDTPRRGDFQKIAPTVDDDTEALAQQ